MSVKVTVAGKEDVYGDLDPTFYHYLISPAGVLSIVEESDDAWRVLQEYSPSGWSTVEGRRRTAPLADLPGKDGYRQEPVGRYGR